LNDFLEEMTTKEAINTPLLQRLVEVYKHAHTPGNRTNLNKTAALVRKAFSHLRTAPMVKTCEGGSQHVLNYTSSATQSETQPPMPPRCHVKEMMRTKIKVRQTFLALHSEPRNDQKIIQNYSGQRKIGREAGSNTNPSSGRSTMNPS
jgi:hypothetical protein